MKSNEPERLPIDDRLAIDALLAAADILKQVPREARVRILKALLIMEGER